jgi:hypothetical protein
LLLLQQGNGALFHLDQLIDNAGGIQAGREAPERDRRH